jgi:hypothetical protein
VLDSTRISNLEQPWLGAILYGVGVNTHKELDLEVLMTFGIFNLKLVVILDLYFLGVCAQVGDPLPCGGFDMCLLVGYH